MLYGYKLVYNYSSQACCCPLLKRYFYLLVNQILLLSHYSYLPVHQHN
jgi:hypothetical protein